MTDMFAPVPPGSDNVVPLRQPDRAPEWRVIMPVPEGVPASPAKHPKRGEPVARWEYRDPEGRLLGLTCRFNLPNGGKDVLPLVFAEHKKWGRQWRWLGFPKPGRPLYGLDRLAARPDALVIICEGEKAADAAAKLLPDHVAITSPGGNKAASLADWSTLAGRRVVIWPDADEPGKAYARDVVAELSKLSPAPSVAIVNPPEGVAEGWDAADARAEGWTAGRAAELVASATPPPAGDETSPAPGKPKAKEYLVGLIEEAELWHNPERVAYATVPVAEHRENYKVGSETFKNWLAWRAYEALGIVPPTEAIEGALRIAKALAINRGPCHRTWRRVAEHDGRLYLDLGDELWRAVEITAEGWQVVDHVPVKFLRAPGMEALPVPEGLIGAEPGEAINRLREFVNVESDADFQLLVAWLAAALRPSRPFSILILNGQQGTSKSTLARICRRLIDPNIAPIRSPPENLRDLMVSADNSWTLIFDNMSITKAWSWLSDAFCCLSTGAGLAARQLHSDRDETIFSAMRPIVLNGIDDLATRGDFAERTLPLTLPLLAEVKRREEREFWAAFDAVLPVILGGLLDGIAHGQRELPNTKLDRLPRMADFARWGAACARGFGWQPDDFLRAYEENRSDAVAQAAEASPLVPLIEALLGRTGLDANGFVGTATALLAKLHEVSSESDRKARWYPASAVKLGSQLRRVAPLLPRRGIEFLETRDSQHSRDRIKIVRCKSEAVFEELRARLMGKSGGTAGGADG